MEGEKGIWVKKLSIYILVVIKKKKKELNGLAQSDLEWPAGLLGSNQMIWILFGSSFF